MALIAAAREALNEYESHGGPGTHQECPDGGYCCVGQEMAKLRVALDAVDAAKVDADDDALRLVAEGVILRDEVTRLRRGGR